MHRISADKSVAIKSQKRTVIFAIAPQSIQAVQTIKSSLSPRLSSWKASLLFSSTEE